MSFALALVVAASTASAVPAPPLADNAEMAAILSADQAPRAGGPIDWEAVTKADADRRTRTRAMLDTGLLRTAQDFYGAAMIFQHGQEAEDHLLAHALAVRALGLGHKKAEWLAAATLDRYLHGVARDQIYGTQYTTRPGMGPSQGRYDRKLLTDQLRVAAGVETLQDQEAKRLSIEQRSKAAK